ncbi:LGFP repeat-containing protein [Corynebacterium sp. A21]|uniref:LGFP repeat-containing protein n=1 Tax=Corynebacterium sp. A21 TaxID=3457318 RepID=UPI003FD5014D
MTNSEQTVWEAVPFTDDHPVSDAISEGYQVEEVGLPPVPEGDADWSETVSPKAQLIPGEMRSDREEIPAGFTKEEADRAEILEAQTEGAQKTGVRSLARTTAMTANSCQIFWPSPYQVCGAIRDKYLAIGGPGSFLSYPRSGELGVPDGQGRRTEFINGYIYWHPSTGAHSITTHFSFEWGRLGWETSPLGYPISEEFDGEVPLSRVQRFENGELYGSLSGLAAIYGSIRDRWLELGGATGELGLPVISEQLAPDGVGRFTVFERGLIYWSPTTGAVEITGSMLAQWADDPEWWFGELGFPTSSMREEDKGWVQDFQHGAMYAATARPPWKSCGLLTDPGKVVRSWTALSGTHEGQRIQLRCGSGDSHGVNHIKKSHLREWQTAAAPTWGSWMDVADLAITKSLLDADTVVNNVGKTCYSGEIYLHERVRDVLVQVMNPSIIVGNVTNDIVTAIPGNQCENHRKQ